MVQTFAGHIAVTATPENMEERTTNNRINPKRVLAILLNARSINYIKIK